LFTTTSDSSFLHPCILLEVVKCITYRLPDGKPNFTWDQTWKIKRLETESTPERGFTSWGPLVSYVSNGGSPPDK